MINRPCFGNNLLEKLVRNVAVTSGDESPVPEPINEQVRVTVCFSVYDAKRIGILRKSGDAAGKYVLVGAWHVYGQ